jgi:eukaryotic-like serine/threonine-protein kinase
MPQSGSHGGAGAAGTPLGEGPPDAASGALAPLPVLVAGTIIADKYRLEEVIGEGGMGSVWRAHHLQLDLAVAIKVLRAGPDLETLCARMKIEARAAARLIHPAIVRVFDVDTTEARHPFIVMELLSGESLWDVLERGPLSGVKAVQLLLPIAEALALAHAKGIAHRDLKPHNIFVSMEAGQIQPKLLDFGIAKLTTSPLPSGSLTDTGVVLGSPDYMSPEQARGRSDVDHRADIWQFCSVLYETITTDTPFTGDNYNALMRAIVEDEPAPLPLDENADERLAELIAWGLRKEREERPESMQVLAQSLAEWLIARGVMEDVCGVALAPKWLGQSLPDSASRTQESGPRSPERSPRAPRKDTLVSASDAVSDLNARERSGPRVVVLENSSNRVWLTLGVLALGLLALAMGSAWLAMRRPAPQSAAPLGETRVAPAAAKAPVEIASTPPAPSPLEMAPVLAPSVSSASAARNSANSAPPLSSRSTAPSATPRDAKSAPDPGKPAPAAQPGRDMRDETRELLQAY